MAWTLILMLSSVIFLGGCVQNASQPEETPAKVHEIADRTEPAGVDTSLGKTSYNMEVKNGSLPSGTVLDSSLPTATTASTSEENQSVAQVDLTQNDQPAVMASSGITAGKTAIQENGETTAEKNQERLVPGKNPGDAPTIVNQDSETKPSVVTTGSAMAKEQTVNASEITTGAAYTSQVLPLLQKIRTLHTDSATRLDNILKSGKLMAEAELNASSEGQAIFQAMVLTLAVQDTKAQDSKQINELLARSKVMASNLIKNRDRMNSRFLFENLVYAQVSVADWKFEKLTAIEASSAVLRQGLTRFKLMSVEPRDSFNTRNPEFNVENCRLSIVYQNAEKGTLIRVIEPEWREFEIPMDFQKPTQEYMIRPSLAGEQYKELEVQSKALTDKTYYKLSLRYVDQKAIGDTPGFRRLDHVLLEKVGAENKAERSLMCRVLAQ